MTTETQEAPPQEAAPQEPAQAPAQEQAPVETPPQEPEPPREDPRIAQLMEQNKELMRLLAEQKQAPAQQPQQPAEPEVDKFFDEHFQPEFAQKLKQAFSLIEQRNANRYATRQEFEPVRQTAYAVAGNAAEGRAIEELRSRNVPEPDIKEALSRARRESADLAKQGLYSPPNVLVRAALSDIQSERGYAAADKERAAKAAVAARQAKAAPVQPAAPNGAGEPKISEDDMRGGILGILKASRAKGLGPKAQ